MILIKKKRRNTFINATSTSGRKDKRKKCCTLLQKLPDITSIYHVCTFSMPEGCERGFSHSALIFYPLRDKSISQPQTFVTCFWVINVFSNFPGGSSAGVLAGQSGEKAQIVWMLNLERIVFECLSCPSILWTRFRRNENAAIQTKFNFHI